MTPELARRILENDRLKPILRAVSVEAILRDLPSISPDDYDTETDIDWNFALLCTSLLVEADEEAAQAAILRICQACALSPTSNLEQRLASLELLERAGNNRTSEMLSEQIDRATEGVEVELPVAARIESLRARMEYTIVRGDGTVFGVNRFQRRLWDRAAQSQWLSVSAPTSAGKSFVVRQWIADRLGSAEQMQVVYLVPTRALVEEVAAELRVELSDELGVHTLPWDADIGTRPREVFVFTQERLHLLLEQDKSFAPSVVFIDEAQKFGDDSRGVLLQRVLDELARRDLSVRVLMASPLSDNPEVLLEVAPPTASRDFITASTVTVPQNLFWLDQVPRKPKLWTATWVAEDLVNLGTIELEKSPSPKSFRLPMLAAELGASGGGSVVYVNGAADAEKVALQLHSLLEGRVDTATHPRVVALRELVSSTVHSAYALNVSLTRGIAFHYGNMPHLIRAEIESLFRDGIVQFLVCTSTLLEGVNLPCRNLFVSGPKRGSKPMSQADFWNLAGRAGRWGQELQGNIFCIDTKDEKRWPEVPRDRVRYPLVRATQRVLEDSDQLVEYIVRGGRPDGTSTPTFESVFSYASSQLLQERPLSSLPGFAELDEASARAVEQAVTEALDGYQLPPEFVTRHAGISPLALQRLLEDFRGQADPSKLVVAPPESPDAAETMVSALGRLVRACDAPFGVRGQTWVYAILIVNWMRGDSLARLIAARIDWKSKKGGVKVAAEIRGCMRDVEQIARFEAPRYLAAYIDVLRFHLNEIGVAELMPEMPDLAMLLELGVSRVTEMSMMSLGLSRTTVVELSEFIADGELDSQAALVWLSEADLEALPIPELVRREIGVALDRAAR